MTDLTDHGSLRPDPNSSQQASTRDRIPSALYTHLRQLTVHYLTTTSLDTMLSLRTPDSTHSWGHNHLVSLNPALGPLNSNAEFESHLTSTGPYLAGCETAIKDIMIDEWAMKSTVRMSYFLTPSGPPLSQLQEKSTNEAGTETIENDLIWILTFTNPITPDDLDGIRIKDSVEFIDATASARFGQIARRNHGSLNPVAKGGITVVLEGTA
jgi:hypothetical protein